MSSLYASHYNDERELQLFFLLSLILHGIFVMLLIGANWIFGWVGPSLREENIAIVEGSVRVDVVAMPRLTVKELQSLSQMAARSGSAPAAPKVESKPEEQAPVPKVADDSKAPVLETKSESAMDVLKRTAARRLKTTQNSAPVAESSESSGLSEAEQARLRQLVIAGNRLSEGSSIVGSGQGAEMTAFNAYILALPDLVRVHWKLPSFLSEQDLRARIRIYLRANGELIRTEVFESSGNQEYDKRAREAVERAAPFPAMEEGVARRASRGDIVLGFPL